MEPWSPLASLDDMAGSVQCDTAHGRPFPAELAHWMVDVQFAERDAPLLVHAPNPNVGITSLVRERVSAWLRGLAEEN